MKCLFPVPQECLAYLGQATQTGPGYQIVSVELKDGRRFDQAVVSEGCIIQVRGYNEIPFSPGEVRSVSVNHKAWNFRDGSDSRFKTRAACG